MLKAGSPTTDSSDLALLASLLLTQVGARVWYEHAPSACNPADPLSRAAHEDRLSVAAPCIKVTALGIHAHCLRTRLQRWGFRWSSNFGCGSPWCMPSPFFRGMWPCTTPALFSQSM
eukprot:3179452-Amphidinium_carterae.1